ncbi:ribosome maturation factor RimP [Clostridium oceanicum]|uniref:Ribosome maturation factor RimP n=1 Tax=Clostridium oceanicum TaxID=1543 RepID=A0ABN1JBI0_9CLOT
MSKSSIMKELRKNIVPIVEELEYELYFIELVKEGKENFLRIYIDNDKGISLDDCEKVSRRVSELLDEIDPIPYSYYLEVSSPGISRTLHTDKHLEKYIGYEITINLFAPIDKKKKFEGKLLEFDKSEVKISEEDKEVIVPREKISKITLKEEL